MEPYTYRITEQATKVDCTEVEEQYWINANKEWVAQDPQGKVRIIKVSTAEYEEEPSHALAPLWRGMTKWDTLQKEDKEDLIRQWFPSPTQHKANQTFSVHDPWEWAPFVLLGWGPTIGLWCTLFAGGCTLHWRWKKKWSAPRRQKNLEKHTPMQG